MVYHGPSAGCKTCRTRRVKCDQTKPHCKNCSRRHETCPGYGDLFDGAHRNQNNAIIRRMERQNAPWKAESVHSTPSSGRSLELSPSTSRASSPLSSVGVNPPLQWIMYSAPTEHPPETHECEKDHRTTLSDSNVINSPSTIPDFIMQDPEEASICFFFRYYTGVIHDPHANKTFTMMWQPMYLRSSSDSPLRMATAAVTVNIAIMWNFQGCDTRPARRLYAKAISAMRQALSAPSPSQSALDELLMTTLVFDLYDSLLAHYLPERPPPGKHKQGALALVKHRGPSNYATELGRELVSATRHTLLHHALAFRAPLPPEAEQYFEHPSVSNSRVKQLDLLAISLANAQSRFWTLRRKRAFRNDLDHRSHSYEEVIAEALRINEHFAAWKRGITDSHWLPKYVWREEILSTIKDAGFYGDRCAVWADLAFANIWNIYHIRQLLTLQMIRQAYADEPNLPEDTASRAILSMANSEMQASVDAICETVPHHLGDTVVPTNPIYSQEINFPYKVMTDPQTGRTTTIPTMDSVYKPRAAAAGGWMIFAPLIAVCRLAEPEDDAAPLTLREGQLDWIKGQIKRLQTIFMFCDPLWFKRSPPAHGSVTDDLAGLNTDGE